MAWLVLFLSGLLEIGWAVGLRASVGFTRPGITVATVLVYVASFVLLGLALRTLPLGTAYAVWTGIGTVGTVAVGIAFLGESADWPRLACIALILAGIAGLKMLSSE